MSPNRASTNRRRVWHGFSVKVIVFLLLGLEAARACVGCRQPGVGPMDEPQTALAGDAFSWSVITLLVVVFSVVGFLAVYIARTCQRLDRANAVS